MICRAQTIATDIFHNIFAKDPRDPDAWDRYVESILEYGGSHKENEIVEALLGRPTNTDAFLKEI